LGFLVLATWFSSPLILLTHLPVRRILPTLRCVHYYYLRLLVSIGRLPHPRLRLRAFFVWLGFHLVSALLAFFTRCLAHTCCVRCVGCLWMIQHYLRHLFTVQFRHVLPGSPSGSAGRSFRFAERSRILQHLLLRYTFVACHFPVHTFTHSLVHRRCGHSHSYTAHFR